MDEGGIRVMRSDTLVVGGWMTGSWTREAQDGPKIRREKTSRLGLRGGLREAWRVAQAKGRRIGRWEEDSIEGERGGCHLLAGGIGVQRSKKEEKEVEKEREEE